MPKSLEKPLFSVVSGKKADIPPPRPLGTHGITLWDRVQSEYRIDDIGGVELLAQACAELDRAESLAEAVARDGTTVRTRGGVPKIHPGIKEELACRAFIVRTLERLGLNVEVVRPGPGRPPRPGGWVPEDDAS